MRNGLRESAFVLDVDRQLALLRFPHPKPNHPGFGCVTINCEFKEHEVYHPTYLTIKVFFVIAH